MTDARCDPVPDQGAFGVGWSSIGLWLSAVVGGMLIIMSLLGGFRRHPSGVPRHQQQLLGYCSLPSYKQQSGMW